MIREVIVLTKVLQAVAKMVRAMVRVDAGLIAQVLFVRTIVAMETVNNRIPIAPVGLASSLLPTAVAIIFVRAVGAVIIAPPTVTVRGQHAAPMVLVL